eukprot:6197406-Pleurochrysis_carterae.AAC.1
MYDRDRHRLRNASVRRFSTYPWRCIKVPQAQRWELFHSRLLSRAWMQTFETAERRARASWGEDHRAIGREGGRETEREKVSE